MKHKRIVIYLITVIFTLVFLTACGEDEQPEAPQQVTPEEIQEPDSAEVERMKTEAEEKIKREKEAAEKAAQPKVPETYVVQDGETLASIAEKFYGDSQKWFHIFAANEPDIHDWNNIYTGQELNMPQFEE